MSRFHYQAVDGTGQPVVGTVEAVSEADARSQLLSRGLVIETLAELEAATPLPITEFLSSPRSSLSILTNLRALGEDIIPVRARPAVQELADRIERGESPLVAYSAVRDRLPVSMRTLLQLGLERGRLDLLLSSYLDHSRRMSDIRASLWTSLAYPLFLFMVVIGVCLGMVLYITPMFIRIFEDFDTQLPYLTLMIVNVTQVLRQYGGYIVLGLLFLAFCIWGILHVVGGPGLPQKVFRGVPCLGSVFRWASLSSLCELLAMLVELELPLPEALRTAAKSTDDYSLALGLQQSAEQLTAGVPVGDLSYALPVELRATLRWANQPAVLIEALRSSGQVFSARSRVDLHLTRWMLEPVAVFTVAVCVGVTAISLFMPLVKLLNDLS